MKASGALICKHCHHIIPDGIKIDVKDTKSDIKDIFIDVNSIKMEGFCNKCNDFRNFMVTDNNIAYAVAEIDKKPGFEVAHSSQGKIIATWNICKYIDTYWNAPYIAIRRCGYTKIPKKWIKAFEKAGFTNVSGCEEIGGEHIDCSIKNVDFIQSAKLVWFELDKELIRGYINEVLEEYSDHNKRDLNKINEDLDNYFYSACMSLAEILGVDLTNIIDKES